MNALATCTYMPACPLMHMQVLNASTRYAHRKTKGTHYDHVQYREMTKRNSQSVLTDV